MGPGFPEATSAAEGQADASCCATCGGLWEKGKALRRTGAAGYNPCHGETWRSGDMLLRLPAQRLPAAGDGRPLPHDGRGLLQRAAEAGEEERPVRAEGDRHFAAEVAEDPEGEKQEAAIDACYCESGEGRAFRHKPPCAAPFRECPSALPFPPFSAPPRWFLYAQKKWARRCLLKAASSPFALVEVPS